jgi:hypothetical protein
LVLTYWRTRELPASKGGAWSSVKKEKEQSNYDLSKATLKISFWCVFKVYICEITCNNNKIHRKCKDHGAYVSVVSLMLLYSLFAWWD